MKYLAEVQNSTNWETEFGDWISYQGFYGDAQCVEVDASFEEQSFRVLLALNFGVDGGYAVRMSRENGRIAMTLFKSVIRYTAMDCVWLDELGILPQPEQVFHLALKKEGSTVSVELDGKQLLSCVDSQLPMFTAGRCGYVVYPIRGNTTKIHNFTVSGEQLPVPEKVQAQKPQPVTYEMVLGAEGSLPECWMNFSNIPGFSVKNGALTSPETDYAESLIYQFDDQPQLTARFTVEKLKNESQFGFLLRKAPQTAFVKVAYSAQKGCWYVQDVPALYDCSIQTFEGMPWKPETGREYEAKIVTSGSNLNMTIDGVCVLSAVGLRQCNHGKTGVFADNCLFGISVLKAEFASGVAPAAGALSYCADEHIFQASFETEVLLDGTLVGITKEARYVSTDRGVSFRDASAEYEGLDSKKYYQSILQIHDGSYLQIVAGKGGEVQKSDDLKNWQTIGMLGDEADTHNIAEEEYIFHTGSMTEIPNPNGGWRLFMPMGTHTQKTDHPVYPGAAHDTVIYYSDDNGKTWQKTQPVGDAFEQQKRGYLVDWGESKVISCTDGTLRLYCSRNCSRFFTALISSDFGLTWSTPTPVRHVQCPRASFGVYPDPQDPNVWYLACVNDTPLLRGHLQRRTRLSLYRTYNGKDWEFLTDVERFGIRLLDEPDMENRPLYQIVDPAILVDEQYVYVTWGASLYGARGAVFVNTKANPAGSGRLSHNEQRSHFARFEKSKLFAQPWSAATVADMTLLDADLSDEMW